VLSRKIKPDKASFQERFIVTWKINSVLKNVRFKDENSTPYPVLYLFMSIEGYIPQSTDIFKAESSGGYLLRGFGVNKVLHTRRSWESLGISKGKLPSTMLYDQHGNEVYPYMTMNGIIIDEFLMNS
jgi:hypothetical protein